MLAFHNGFKYRNSTSFCAILVKIGPLTPKISEGVSVLSQETRHAQTDGECRD